MVSTLMEIFDLMEYFQKRAVLTPAKTCKIAGLQRPLFFGHTMSRLLRQTQSKARYGALPGEGDFSDGRDDSTNAISSTERP